MDEIVGAAERITFKNIHQRLPVPQTGDEFERISEALNRMIGRLDEAFQIAATAFPPTLPMNCALRWTIIQGNSRSS